MKKMTAIFLCVVLLVSVGAKAFALELRLVEERTGSERTEYIYDDSGRIKEEHFYLGDDLMETRKCSYGKDGSLVEKSIIRNDYTLYFHYDVNNTQIELENPGMGGDCFSLEYAGDVVYELRDENRRTVMVTVTSGENSSEMHYYYVYDQQKRIQIFEIENIRKDVFTYNSDGSFVRTSIDLMNGSSTEREVYNSDGKLIRAVSQYGDTTEYTYNENGLLCAEYYEGTKSYVCEYGYDQFGRMLSKTVVYPNGVKTVTTYWYDWVLD